MSFARAVLMITASFFILEKAFASSSGENSARVPFEFEAFTAIYGSLLLSQVVVMVIGIVITEALNKAIDLKKVFE